MEEQKELESKGCLFEFMLGINLSKIKQEHENKGWWSYSNYRIGNDYKNPQKIIVDEEM